MSRATNNSSYSNSHATIVYSQNDDKFVKIEGIKSILLCEFFFIFVGNIDYIHKHKHEKKKESYPICCAMLVPRPHSIQDFEASFHALSFMAACEKHAQ